MTWSRVGTLALPYALYVFIALFALDSFGFEKLLNPLYSSAANVVLQLQSTFPTETLLGTLALLRLLVFAFGFALLYSPALLVARRPRHVAALVAPAVVLAYGLMATQPLMLPFVSRNDLAHISGVLFVLVTPKLLWALAAAARRLAANKSTKPTPRRGAA